MNNKELEQELIDIMMDEFKSYQQDIVQPQVYYLAKKLASREREVIEKFIEVVEELKEEHKSWANAGEEKHIGILIGLDKAREALEKMK